VKDDREALAASWGLLKIEIHHLRKALELYGEHLNSCSEGDACSCGLREALARAKRAEEMR
jgi:hypothetical protein